MAGQSTIGDRIRALREFRDVTQEELAARSGIHVDTIRKLEQGQRRSARLTTLRAIAAALDTELERLLGSPTVTSRPPEDRTGGLLALRDAIQDVTGLPGVPVDDASDAPPDKDAWADAVREATALYWQGGYSTLAGRLPLLLHEGRAVAREATAAEAPRVWAGLALAYQLAASLATQAGHTAWAFQAVEAQLHAAARASDPLMAAMGVSTLSWVLLRQGRWEEAQRVAERKAEEIEPVFRKATKAQLAVYGNVLLAAAIPAARRGRGDEADEFLNLAEATAVRSGPLRSYGTAFSPVDVRTQQVNAALAGETPEPGKALMLAARVELPAISRPVHSAAHRVDVAQARYQSGDCEGALATLLEVERDQPEWIRYQTLATSTVREMLETSRRRNCALRNLAARLGVDPSL
ncbi:helix-turn-helix domain-containing protein [Streptomyces zingiberis]|uniref:Helix-turn-helix transcriptional regulator n=1 Tax=Streptomyces zingiberis TaxID=2053010 RepID=A0ABX1C1M2_9ACTN|nr:helix-turn-helix transcriptional regulator [Streptomyces zingiberis]NJQ02503.1 helix-turn-helix transcriptional regulator [Streptomyces zingiberis]